MFTIRNVSEEDRVFWLTLDAHLAESEFRLKIRDRRGYVLCEGHVPVGLMRYSLFWDHIPFLNLIHLEEPSRGKGFGREALRHWEDEMRALGYALVMTSTQEDEQAQHFYRKLGYRDMGALSFDHTPIEQARELFLVKVL